MSTPAIEANLRQVREDVKNVRDEMTAIKADLSHTKQNSSNMVSALGRVSEANNRASDRAKMA